MHPFLEFFIPQINQQLKNLKIGGVFSYIPEKEHLWGILTIGEKRYHVLYSSSETPSKQNLQDQLNLDLLRIFYNEFNQLKKTHSNFDFEIATAKLNNITIAVKNPALMVQINPTLFSDSKIYDFATGALNIKLIEELIIASVKRVDRIFEEKIRQLKNPEPMIMPMIKFN